MALDNWKPAIEVFQKNHPVAKGAEISVGRTADLSWFNHPSEALLFYLAHYSEACPDAELMKSLRALGFGGFVDALSKLDESFERELQLHVRDVAHASALEGVDPKVFTLALGKAVFGRLHLSSLRDLKLGGQTLPWVSERGRFDGDVESERDLDKSNSKSKVFLQHAKSVWDQSVGQIENASNAKGRGQHKGNAARMASLHSYFVSNAGIKLKSIWVKWYGERLRLRSEFCLATYEALKQLYSGGRRVGVLLGGPPCKGFSRIGRAVIRELRDQGAHAWSSNEFGDERNALMYHYVVFLEALQPQIFLFENVSNFASKLKTPDGDFDAPRMLEELIDAASSDLLHYNVEAKIVRAREHAIPQSRERYIMCGVRSDNDLVRPREVLSIPKQSSDVTLGEALSGLGAASVFKENGVTTSVKTEVGSPAGSKSHAAEQYYSWIRSSGIDGTIGFTTDAHMYRQPRADDQKFYKYLGPGVRWMDLKTPSSTSVSRISSILEQSKAALSSVLGSKRLVAEIDGALNIVNESLALRLLLEQISVGLDDPHHLLGDGYLSNGSGQHGDWLERLSAEKPCKTVVAHIGKDTYGYVHPFEARPITIREAARVQAFPDWFTFGGVGVVDAYSMIGNAVPPLLSRQFAHQIYLALSGELARGSAATSSKKEKRDLSAKSDLFDLLV